VNICAMSVTLLRLFAHLSKHITWICLLIQECLHSSPSFTSFPINTSAYVQQIERVTWPEVTNGEVLRWQC
jgi:hypothetical protein